MLSIGLNFRVGASGKLSAFMWGGVVAGFVLLPNLEAFGQDAGALVGLDGNDAQEDAARLVDNTCPELVPPFVNGELDEDGNQLVTVCSNMIVDQLLASGDNPDLLAALLGLGFEGYGLDADGLNNALQGLHGEEIQAAQSRTKRIRSQQAEGIFSRLAGIRSGQIGGGISVAGLGLEADGETYSPTDLALLDQDQYEIRPAAWLDDDTWSKLGIFVTGGVTLGEKDTTGQSDGFDFDSLNLTLGFDYRLTDQFVLGAALGYNKFDSDVETTSRSPAGEDLGSNGYLLSVFASQGWDSGLFIDGLASFGQDDYDSTRRIVIESSTGAAPIDETANGDFDAKHYSFAANLGYQVPINAFTITPVARMEYFKADFDGFTESGAGGLNLTFDDFDAKSLRGQIGVEASYSFSTDQGVLVPSLRAEYIHEFEDEDNGAQVIFANGVDANAVVDITTEGVDQDYGIIGASLTALGEGGMSAFVDYTTVLALNDFEIHRIKAGFRWEF